MDIKLLALDLDGTALHSNNTLSPAVAEAIESAAENGIEIVAASGRPYGSMPPEVLRLRGVNYVISSNGAAIHDRTGRRIHETPLRESAVLQLLALTADVDLIWEAFLDGETYTDNRYLRDPIKYGCTPAYVSYVQGSRGGLNDMRRYIYENRCRLDSVEYVCPDKALRESVRKRLEQHLQNVYITSSSANFVEFMDENATKSAALRRLCDLLSVTLSQTAACGNADNDADMIACAGLGAAVANASESCKRAASVILPSNNDDGVVTLIDLILKNNTIPPKAV